jgi:two-component system sensor histidine kinase PilS (NtrC family)
MIEPDLRHRVAWLIGIRAVISTVLLGGAILAQLRSPGSFPVDPLFFLIAFTYGLTVVYAMTIRFVGRHPWLAEFQLAGDALIVSALIYCTGGVTSYVSSLYVLPIVAAASIRFRRGGLMVAALTSTLYTTIVVAQYLTAAGLLQLSLLTMPDGALPPLSVAQYTVALNLFGFFAVALLSGTLAENVRSAGARLEQASTEIAGLQALNQYVIDSLAGGLVTTDRAHRILTFNRAASAITGVPLASAVGRRVDEILQLPASLLTTLDEELSPGTVRRVELRYLTADDRGHIELGLGITHLQTPDGRAGFLVTFQDVTDIKRLEHDARLRQRLAAVGEMAAGIAHEIRNPLASMSGSIQILRQELPLTSEQEQLMDIVLRESERLNTTIRSFLAYARPQRFEVARLDVRRPLQDTALLLRNSADVLDSHTIEVDVPSDELWYEADEGQIRQIVWNLATNGLRAMPGGGRLQLAGSAEDEGGGVVLTVRDEGVGIAADQLDGLFQPFQGSFAKGSGLGLAIVHRIVSDYHGEIRVSSQPGVGTTVSVRLPARVEVTA